MASEALLGNRGHFNAFLFDDAKPHPGMVRARATSASCSRTRGWRSTARSCSSGGMRRRRTSVELDRQVQDKYSIRCAPHVTGVAARHARVGRAVGRRSRSTPPTTTRCSTSAGGRVESGGNFYGGHIGQAMDSLKVALANLCDLIDRQLELVVDEKFNAGLTANLIPRFDADHPEAGTAPRLQGHAAVLLGDDRRGDEAVQPGHDPLALDRVPQPGQGLDGRRSPRATRARSSSSRRTSRRST